MKHAALAGFALESYVTTHGSCQPTTDGEAQAGARVVTAGLLKLLEYGLML